MAWSELQQIPNEYNEQFKAIDDSLIRLLLERKSLAKGKHIFPPREIMEEWTVRYGMDISHVSWLLHSLNEGSEPAMPVKPRDLLGVLPIMRKSVVEGVEFLLTHSMQHANGSEVYVEIQHLESEEQSIHLRPRLLLEVRGPQQRQYSVRRSGSHGSNLHAQLRFMVTPRLPDNLGEVRFALIPFAIPAEVPLKELILDKDVYFE
ncbi:MAG: hypothetical protein K0R57_4519 [Paenibacillaceae bacterium]|jgi:hypothetical protein|nr:hypothetical protein [Paenibacillaceae bacterium]